MGCSWSFVATREGYYAARAKIDEILQKGHLVGGDISKVMSYTGQLCVIFLLARLQSCLFSYLVVKLCVVMAKKNNTKRKLVGLVSEESGVRAYYTKKNTMNTPDKLSLKKYDPVLRKHVVFTETKKNLGRNEVKEKKR